MLHKNGTLACHLYGYQLTILCSTSNAPSSQTRVWNSHSKVVSAHLCEERRVIRGALNNFSMTRAQLRYGVRLCCASNNNLNSAFLTNSSDSHASIRYRRKHLIQEVITTYRQGTNEQREYCSEVQIKPISGGTSRVLIRKHQKSETSQHHIS